MKRNIFILTLMLGVVFIAGAKDLKTLCVTTQPQMTCSNCENKIKKNIRFEKGIHEISTDLEGQTVKIVYDADKTSEDKIIEAFGKIKYKAIKLDDAVNGAPATEGCSKKGSCCKVSEKESCPEEQEECCSK